tara:strand:+ start:1221 stop:1931 length:711 start_codon:yes stop_codon:yes gene_type:complete
MFFPKLPILLYHSINDKHHSDFNIVEFDNQLSYLKSKGYKSIFLDEFNPNEKKQVIFTFDDGYKDNIVNVLPILKKYSFKAICFIVSNHIGKYNVWDINKKNYNKKELMNNNDIKEWINNGMSIGSHTHNHLDLTKITQKEIKVEISLSKKILEDNFSKPILDFCYPFGKKNFEVYHEVKKLYKSAFTTNRSRYQFNKHDQYLIPRVDMGKKLNKFKIFLKLNTYYEDIKFYKNEI